MCEALNRVLEFLENLGNFFCFPPNKHRKLEVQEHFILILVRITAGHSMLIIGPPNSGKTTVLRDLARQLSSKRKNIVVVVDKTCEIAGAADEPHVSIGSARWQPVDKPENQHKCMRLAVENMSPSTVIVDELSTLDEADAARSISLRGVQLIATVHGKSIAELINDKERSALLGGVTSVTLAKSEIGPDGKKQVMMRKFEPLFSLVLELRSRDEWYVYTNVAESIDAYLRCESFRVFRNTPGCATPVTAIPTPKGFDYDPPIERTTKAKCGFISISWDTQYFFGVSTILLRFLRYMIWISGI